jgi:hypothetical protein
MTQQLQPEFFIVFMQSQQAWIMAQQSLSPLMQEMQTPSLVMSHLHMPIVRLQQHTIMPLAMQQTLHMPPTSMEQRFCIILHASLSSQEQVMRIPP